MVTLLPAISVMSFVVIPREERYLEARFGEEYETYRKAYGAGCRLRTEPRNGLVSTQALEGTRRPLIVTTGAAVLGDTGPTPLSEHARLHPLRGF